MKKIVTKKITKTTRKPVSGVITNGLDCDTVTDLYYDYYRAKVRAGKPITIEELDFIEEVAVNTFLDKVTNAFVDTILSCPCQTIEVKSGEKLVFDAEGNARVKKPNIFKRFWNWVTGK